MRSARSWTLPTVVLLVAGICLGIGVAVVRYPGSVAAAPAASIGGPRLRAGTRLRSFELYTATGQKRNIVFSASQPKRLFYFSATGSRACERNHAAITSLAEQLKTKAEVVGVTIDTSPAVSAEADEGEVMDAVIRAFAIRATPTTVLVSPEGVVEDVWVGAFVEGLKERIERHLHVALPGVSSE